MWPEGFRCAVAFTFDVDAEEGWIADVPANAERPGVLSQGTYEAKVGVPRILALLDRLGVVATFFVPGRVAERHPDRIREIVEAGHELAHHGYTHTPPGELGRDEEELELTKGLEVLRAFDPGVTGYRAPAWDVTPHTIGLLETHGLTYSSNLMDEVRPYRHEGTSIVEVPVQWILDDAAHFWFDAESWTKPIATTQDVGAIWDEEFLGIRLWEGACVLTMHPQLIGRPSRLIFLERFIRSVQGHEDVWIATTREIAARV